MSLDIRPAVVEDVPVIRRFIHDLALWQNMGAEMVSTEEDLRRDGFGPDPRFHAILASVDGAPVGLALYFFTYSTWRAQPLLYVEDLIVDATARQGGIGRALLARLARIALDKGCGRIDLEVRVDNNARGFYERLGLRHKDALLPYAISGEALKDLAD